MKLPIDLQPHFVHSSLIIIGDSTQAKFFLAGGDELEELDGVAVPREERPDSEGKFSDEPNDVPRLMQFVKMTAARTENLVREHGVAHIHLAMPAEIKHLLVRELPRDAATAVGRTLEHDLMKQDILDVIRRLFT